MILQEIFLNISWPLTFAMVLFAGFHFWQCRDGIVQSLDKKTLITALILTAVIAVSVPKEFRVLSDETNILSTSASMLFEKAPHNALTAESYYGLLQWTTFLTPKRPVLFPFLMSVVHMIAGFQPFAGVVVNLLALLTLLILMGLLGGMPLQLLAVSQPIISLNATSGGFDLFAAVMLALSLYVAREYMYRRSEYSLKALFSLLVLLCHCRYESFGYAILIIGCLIFHHYICLPDLLKIKRFLFWCGLFLVPLVMQQILSIGGYEQPTGEPLFAFKYFIVNIKAFLSSLYRIDLFLPYNTGLLSFATLMLAPSVIVGLRNKPSWNKHCLLLLLFVALMNLAIVLFHVAGDPGQSTVARYYIFFAIFSVVLFGVVTSYYKITERTKLIIAVACFFIFHPVAMLDHFHRLNNLNRELKIELAFLGGLPTKNNLIISERAGMFVAHRMPAINFNIANLANKRTQVEMALSKKLYDKAIVFQHVYYKEGLEKAHRLNNWKLKELYKQQIAVDHYLLVSEVELSVQ